MDPQSIQSIVEEVLQQLGQKQPTLQPNQIPIAVSGRHVHLSEQHLAVLFGESYALKKKNDLSQPNQFAAEETVILSGPRGTIERVRVLGPSRNLTQVEVSQTDAFKLGVKPPIRQSGDIKGSSPVTIIGPKGSVYLTEGLIIAQAHIHMSPDDADRFQVKDGQYVQVTTGTERPITFGRVLIRVSPSYRLEMHIDTDEANAGFIRTGQIGELIIAGQAAPSPSPVMVQEVKHASTVFEGKLLTQHDVQQSAESVIQVRKSTIVTPLAKDTARDLSKKIEVIDK
ncbi:phosphate propanoyltransferase [Bacillus aerolatus]|uniref:Phosphate propanoyltransferase n=1 Tax=Bacillus aerolatus TaxID=2653354 RepID=A0A6I1FV83_9BACI|nr:phosphate propanoyltransferase [Bacillus aerolatus]KAB7706653.1 phosphate propanoyltransferase [Bacillus aerolatus]